MANIHDCLQNAMAGGELDAIRGREAQKEFDQLVARYGQSMPRAQAEATAAAHLKEASRASALSRRHKVLAQLQTQVRIKAAIDAADDPSRVLGLLLEYDAGAAGIGYRGESVRSVMDAYIRSFNNDIQTALRATGRTLTGRNRNPAMMRNIIRELHGEASGDLAAKDIADAVRRTQERARQLFNAHGGNIGKLDDFGVSHSHNVQKLRKAGFETWADSIRDRLNWQRITDHKTGQPFSVDGAPPPREVADQFLQQVWDGITTRGWNVRDPSMGVGGKALYNQRAEHRVLHFKSGDDWLAYNAAFGTADPFTAMVGGLHGMARDIAQMRVLGPNPRMGLEYAAQAAQKRANTLRDSKLEARVNRRSNLAKAMLSHLDGSANMPVNEFWASFFGGTRKALVSIKLGSAPLSAVTDLNTMRMAASAVGMNPANVIGRAMKLMGSAEARGMAAAGGYIADSLADMGAAAARFTGDTFAPELVERLSGFTMRASGLAFWTDMNRMAFQMEFAAMLGRSAETAFDDLHPQLRELFDARGITAADWDQLRQLDTVFKPKPGADFITPFHWLEHTTMPRAEAEGLAMRLQMLVEEQMEFAVPSMSIEGRALTLGDTRPGTFAGELLRSTTMFKGFALSFTFNQIRRIMAQATPQSKAMYFASMSAGLLALGAVAVQLKEMAKGRDPRPMTDGKFWMAALFQGGGLGIFGDFFASETSRAGGGLAETLAGPVVGLGSDVLSPIATGVTALVNGDETRFGRDAANFVRYNTPVLSSLWYQRVAFDRLVADQLQRILDPDAEAAWRQQERRRERDFGSATWWERGEMMPSRGPEMSNITEVPRR